MIIIVNSGGFSARVISKDLALVKTYNIPQQVGLILNL